MNYWQVLVGAIICVAAVAITYIEITADAFADRKTFRILAGIFAFGALAIYSGW